MPHLHLTFRLLAHFVLLTFVHSTIERTTQELFPQVASSVRDGGGLDLTQGVSSIANDKAVSSHSNSQVKGALHPNDEHATFSHQKTNLYQQNSFSIPFEPISTDARLNQPSIDSVNYQDLAKFRPIRNENDNIVGPSVITSLSAAEALILLKANVFAANRVLENLGLAEDVQKNLVFLHRVSPDFGKKYFVNHHLGEAFNLLTLTIGTTFAHIEHIKSLNPSLFYQRTAFIAQKRAWVLWKAVWGLTLTGNAESKSMLEAGSIADIDAKMISFIKKLLSLGAYDKDSDRLNEILWFLTDIWFESWTKRNEIPWSKSYDQVYKAHINDEIVEEWKVSCDNHSTSSYIKT
ncbi:hypothetical protein O181_043622 [Austropuccinia psidii MF-1]|uniref:Uncharacterized protein n=1 Tax=Austropuccinia psidii MF-1 TaxID=1389203 RepID=A0A9Q3HH07_9BASI|nr:hypothetical protein [Austropuccinia psidii MF-1]